MATLPIKASRRSPWIPAEGIEPAVHPIILTASPIPLNINGRSATSSIGTRATTASNSAWTNSTTMTSTTSMVVMATAYYVYSYIGNYINDQISERHCGTAQGTAPAPYRRNGTAIRQRSRHLSLLLHVLPETFGPHTYGISTMDSGVFGQDNWKIYSAPDLGARPALGSRGPAACRSQSNQGRRHLHAIRRH